MKAMGRAKDKLVQLHEHAPQRALDGLNRVTGLKFHHWPESLAPRVASLDECEPAPSLVEGNQALPA
ncbi:hypothetical protein D9M68_446260 [compost metagenome]